jgi:Tol biopolymer transport system component/DNA-binding winged helix-turn-helix (wHTH) protein
MIPSPYASYRFSGFRVDPARRLLFGADGQPIPLKPKVFDTLLYLVERAGELVAKQALLDAVWPHVVVEENNLNKAISQLRAAFGEKRDEHRFIVTEPGRGYRFVARVEIIDADVARSPPPPTSLDCTTSGEPHAAPSKKPTERGWAKYGFYAGVAGALAVAVFPFTGGFDEPATTRDQQRLGSVVRVLPVTTYPGDELSPSLSPEGTRVAFSWVGTAGNRDIYVALLDGTGLQRLTEAAEPDSDPSWSPEGSRIAFLRRVDPLRREIIVVPALGGPELSLRSIPNLNLASPALAWTPDGERLLFAAEHDRAGTAIYALGVHTGELTQITAGAGYDTSPAMSPDGEWLAFRRDPTAVDPIGGQLFVQRLGPELEAIGEPIRVPTTARALLHSPSWASDGTSLAFVAGGDILEWHLAEVAPRVVYTASGILGGIGGTDEVSALTLARAVSPPRGVVARVAGNTDIWGMPIDPRTHAATGPAKTRFFSTAFESQPRFSPVDGRSVAFLSNRSGRPQIWIAAADESSARQLTYFDGDNIYPFYLSWSPDGRQLVFYVAMQGAFHVHVIDAEGGPPRRLFSGGGPSWSQDGKHLYVTEGQYVAAGEQFTIARLRLDDHHRVPLFEGFLAFETTDGRRLLYWKDQQRPHLYMRPLAGQPAKNPEEPLVATPPGAIAVVDDGFFYVDLTSEGVPRAFKFYDFASRTSREVAPAPAGTIGTGSLAISPDGTELMYAAQATPSNADLVLLELESP